MQSQGWLKRDISHRRESANPKGATVTANVLFESKAPIKVHYALTLSKRRIVSKTWQLDPKLSVAGPHACAALAWRARSAARPAEVQE
jgi:hypothetical protein